MEELHKWQESFGSLEASDAARVAELAKVKVKSAEAETRLLSLVCSLPPIGTVSDGDTCWLSLWLRVSCTVHVDVHSKLYKSLLILIDAYYNCSKETARSELQLMLERERQASRDALQ